MALPTSRSELKAYIKRELGEPVITVNVADEQMDDRIDAALSFFQDYHFDGSERCYLKHQLTYSNLSFVTASTGTFINGEEIVGQTANTHAKLHIQTSNTTATFAYLRTNPTTPLAVGETIVGKTSNASAVINEIQLGDWDRQSVPVSPLVLSIKRVLQVDGFAVDRGTGLFSWNYQFMMNDLSWLSSSSVISYWMTRSHMQLLNDLFIGAIDVRYNRHTGYMYLDVDWNEKMHPGDYVIVEAQRILDPASYPAIWHDRFLRAYATQLVKKQWGQNLIKYGGSSCPVVLPWMRLRYTMML